MRRAIVLVVAGLTIGLEPAAVSAPSPFVSRQGSQLFLEGRPWRAIGVNLWDFDAGRVIVGDIAGCYYQHQDIDAYLDASFAEIARSTAATAVRTFGFRAMYTGGGRDWSSTDKLLYYAQKHGVRLIPVFGDQYASCGARAKTPTWYRDGYRRIEQPWGISFRSYVVAVARRYRQSPTIAFWQLMNEAASTDQAALLSFSRDMVRAIREEARDVNHLINLGTATGILPSHATLLACEATSGGCNDLSEAHAYDFSDPVPGVPLRSSVDVYLELWNDGGERVRIGWPKPKIEGWTSLAAAVPSSKAPFEHWSLNLVARSEAPWTAYVDDVRVVAAGASQLFSFESGTEGFGSPTAPLSSSARYARVGASSLRAAIAGAATTATTRLIAPPVVGSPRSIELSVLLGFHAPGPEVGSGVGALMHAAVVSRRRPFVLGEAGFHAAVSGLSRCSGYRSVEERRDLIRGALRALTDEEHGIGGFLVWDWKDPSLQVVTSDGRSVRDPSVDCWSLTPGDPSLDVLRTYASAVDAAPLPPPVAAWSETPRMFVLDAPPARAGLGQSVGLLVRMTRGGDPMGGVGVRAAGGCAGAGVTDALGHARFTCTVTRLGTSSVTIAADPARCGCDQVQSFQLVAKHAVSIRASAEVVEHGQPTPVRVSVETTGLTAGGIAWSSPECGRSGVIRTSGRTATFGFRCRFVSAPVWKTARLLSVRVGEGPTTAASHRVIGATTFERIYRDGRTGECIGVSYDVGWLGATSRSGTCTAASAGGFEDWFAWQVPASTRARSMIASGGVLVVSAERLPGYRIDGRFEHGTAGRAFDAIVHRAGSAALLTSNA